MRLFWDLEGDHCGMDLVIGVRGTPQVECVVGCRVCGGRARYGYCVGLVDGVYSFDFFGEVLILRD